MAEAVKANPNPVADTYAAPKADPKDLSPEAAAAISAQARAGNVRTAPDTGSPAQAERPSWLPENYKTPEDAMKSLKEAQAELTRMKQGVAKPDAKPTEPVVVADPKKVSDLKLPEADKAAEGAAAVVEKAGFTLEALQQEFNTHGDIIPESRATLAKAGVTKEMVDTYIEGQKAIAQNLLTDLQVGVAGSTEKFNEMWAWSVRGIPDAEKGAINSALATGDPAVAKLAMSAVHAKWVAAVGQDPQRVMHGTKVATASGDVYTHRDELQKDISSKEYATNEAFRMQVIAKLKRSNI